MFATMQHVAALSSSKYFIAIAINSFCQIGQERKVEAKNLDSQFPVTVRPKESHQSNCNSKGQHLASKTNIG